MKNRIAQSLLSACLPLVPMLVNAQGLAPLKSAGERFFTELLSFGPLIGAIVLLVGVILYKFDVIPKSWFVTWAIFSFLGGAAKPLSDWLWSASA